MLGVGLLAVAFALLATWGHDALPIVMQGGDYSLLVTKGVSPMVWLLTLIAMAALWERKQRALDLWLMLVMWIWLFDIALSAVIGSHRFDLGFYAGRIFGLIAASFLLVTLIIQMARMYAAAMGMAANAEQRFAELARSRSRGDGPPALKDTGTFVQRENIARYRELLGRTTDDRERAALLKLLAEEEAKEPGGGSATKL
jgi:hypothetical protein